MKKLVKALSDWVKEKKIKWTSPFDRILFKNSIPFSTIIVCLLVYVLIFLLFYIKPVQFDFSTKFFKVMLIAAGAVTSFLFLKNGLLEKQPRSTIYGALLAVITFALTFLIPNDRIPRDNDIPYGSLEYGGHHYYIFEDSITEWKKQGVNAMSLADIWL